MTTIRIAGVPEHFNLPWHIALEKDAFAAKIIDLKWMDYPGGTGAMCTDLRENKIDVAVILTEGIIADITKGNPSKIVQAYVESPLIWGIHTGAKSLFTSANQLEGARYAISRLGSGSHLMAIVDAKSRGLDPDKIEFKVVGGLDGALRAFENNEVDAFMWEKFTTKPYCDSGQLTLIGECPTPWPCFVVAVREEFLTNNKEAILAMLEVINGESTALKKQEDAIDVIAERYELEPEDVTKWFASVYWSNGHNLSEETLQETLGILEGLDIIPIQEYDAATFLA